MPVFSPARLPSQSTTSYRAPGNAAIMLRSNQRSNALARPALGCDAMVLWVSVVISPFPRVQAMRISAQEIDEGQGVGLRAGHPERMLSLEDCIAMCGLTEEEVRALAQHEHIPEVAAAELGNYLVSSQDGELCIKAMIRDDVAHANACGDQERELTLKLLLRNFVLQHPRCEERHRRELRLPERRLAGEG